MNQLREEEKQNIKRKSQEYASQLSNKNNEILELQKTVDSINIKMSLDRCQLEAAVEQSNKLRK